MSAAPETTPRTATAHAATFLDRPGSNPVVSGGVDGTTGCGFVVSDAARYTGATPGRAPGERGCDMPATPGADFGAGKGIASCVARAAPRSGMRGEEWGAVGRAGSVARSTTAVGAGGGAAN